MYENKSQNKIAEHLKSSDRDADSRTENQTTIDSIDDDKLKDMLHIVTQDTRFQLVQNILAHPESMPTLFELSYANPSKSKSTIRDHLSKLIEYDIVETVELPKEERSRDLPHKFYRVTEDGVRLLEEHGLLKAQETLERLYESLEKSEKVDRYEKAPRPEPVAEEEGSSSNQSSIDRILAYIQKRKPNSKSIDQQIKIVQAMFEAGIGPSHEGITRDEVEDRFDLYLDFTAGTVLKQLADVELVEEQSSSSPNTFIISERLDDVINGRINEVVREDIDALIDHIHDNIYQIDMDKSDSVNPIPLTDGAGRTIVDILAEEFDLEPEEVEPFLRQGDQIEKLNDAISAIEKCNVVEKRDDYGRIVFVNSANRYRLSERAVDLLEDASSIDEENFVAEPDHRPHQSVKDEVYNIVVSETMSAESPVILIVEDEPDLAELYANWLKDAYNVQVSTQGDEAISKLDGQVDVVLLDRRMPRLSGDEVLREIQNRGLDCRVAILSAVEPDFDVLGMDFDDYLVKPISREELIATVERMLSLDAYNEKVREYFTLASKIAILEQGMGGDELEASEEYNQLVQRLSDIRARLESSLDDLGQPLLV